MWKYWLKRSLLMFPTLSGAVVTFFLIRVIPGTWWSCGWPGMGSGLQAAIDAEPRALRPRPAGVEQLARGGVDRWGGPLDFALDVDGSRLWDEIKLRFALSLQVAIMATLVAVVAGGGASAMLAAFRQTKLESTYARCASSRSRAWRAPRFWLGI